MDENHQVKASYVRPQVLATYSREELAETIRPHGPRFGYNDSNEPGCGCGCGCSIIP